MRYGDDIHSYELVDGWADLPDGQSFLDVGSICVDENDDVLVLNRGPHPVMVFDAGGDSLSAWGDGHFSDRPHGMGLGPEGDVYCTDDGNHTVRKFTPDGELLMTLGTEGEPSDTGYRHARDLFERIASIRRGAGPFNKPTDVTVFDSGETFVADGYGNARVHAFDPEGGLIRSWGEPGPDPGEFRLPHSIHHDGDGRIWVTDRENSRIQIFDADGEFVTEWTDLIRPTDVAIVGDTVYVSELCNRISVFTIDGEVLTRWGNEGHPADDPLFLAPHAIAVDSNGALYVGEVSYTHAGTDRGARTVQKFERVE
ncbi:MAG: peptidyl-alpha-hydroxyglycine alpha-amidating lyase family protein [Haloarculaceae archaeon]